jgi:Putative lumazine-binding
MQMPAPRDADERDIEAVVHDYYKGWYEGDAERMRRAVHPGLAKRAPLAAIQAFRPDVEGDPDSLNEDTANTMIDATARGIGTKRATSPEERAIEVVIEDVYGWIANVTVRSPIYHEYLHLARTSDGWRIVNALWQRT